MENEIKVGEYTRNEDGYIERIDSFDKLTNIYKDEEGILRKWEGEDVWGNEYSSIIVKHSSNLIDLIQEGDILRIRMQFHHEIEPIYTLKEIVSKENAEWENILEQIDLCHYEVVEIYTKEMMESISYKVKQEENLKMF